MTDCLIHHTPITPVCKAGYGPCNTLNNQIPSEHSARTSAGGDGYACNFRDLACLLPLWEVAQILRKSIRQVRKLWYEGNLPDPIYVGRIPTWPHVAIRAWSRRQNMKGVR